MRRRLPDGRRRRAHRHVRQRPVVKEIIVDLDDSSRRLCWTAKSERMTHHNASMQIFADGDGARAVWIADLLPNEVAPAIGAMIEQGMGAMKKTLERAD
ncbi:MAG TPA: SRPBCC family protein [Burkholderiales bacterium]|nr:SRPBCC family protein [Burkholderiales bacterium]